MGWLLLSFASLLSAGFAAGCAVHPDPSREPRALTPDQQEQPPEDIERTPPPRRPSTTCPPAMKGSC
jgi:hypothetical protein